MHNYRVEEEKPPVDGSTQNHDIDNKGHNDVLEKHGMALNEGAGPERIEEST